MTSTFVTSPPDGGNSAISFTIANRFTLALYTKNKDDNILNSSKVEEKTFTNI